MMEFADDPADQPGDTAATKPKEKKKSKDERIADYLRARDLVNFSQLTQAAKVREANPDLSLLKALVKVRALTADQAKAAQDELKSAGISGRQNAASGRKKPPTASGGLSDVPIAERVRASRQFDADVWSNARTGLNLLRIASAAVVVLIVAPLLAVIAMFMAAPQLIFSALLLAALGSLIATVMGLAGLWQVGTAPVDGVGPRARSAVGFILASFGCYFAAVFFNVGSMMLSSSGNAEPNPRADSAIASADPMPGVTSPGYGPHSYGATPRPRRQPKPEPSGIAIVLVLTAGVLGLIGNFMGLGALRDLAGFLARPEAEKNLNIVGWAMVAALVLPILIVIVGPIVQSLTIVLGLGIAWIVSILIAPILFSVALKHMQDEIKGRLVDASV